MSDPTHGPAWWEDDPPPSAWLCHDTPGLVARLVAYEGRRVPPGAVADFLRSEVAQRGPVLDTLVAVGAIRVAQTLRDYATWYETVGGCDWPSTRPRDPLDVLLRRRPVDDDDVPRSAP